MKNQIQNLKCYNEEYSKLVAYILSFSTYSIYDKKVRNDSTIFVVKDESKKDLNFYLYSLNYRRNIPRVFTEKKIKYDGDIPIYTYLYIDDFLAVEENIGNGSILLNALICCAKSLGYYSIIGWLSPVDREHFDKLEYFYKKHGFEVNFSENKNEGNIKLILNS